MCLVPAWAAPSEVACACGCSIFDVGDVYDTVPTHPGGGMLWFRYAYMNQNQNWEGTSPGNPASNVDKRLGTGFYYVGGQWTFNRKWTMMAELPMFTRSYTTTDNGTVAGPPNSLYTAWLGALGDFRVMADYTGLRPDMSTGLEFGLKLPTGLWQSPSGPRGGAEFDRDTLPGTGSTDLMLGAYHIGNLDARRKFPYELQLSYSVAVLTQDGYRPGNELDLSAGAGYHLRPALTPWLTLIGTFRASDSGANADPLNTGYSRLFVAPGLEVRFSKFDLYGDAEFPIYQDVNSAVSPAIEGTTGQLVAPVLYKVQISRNF
ncbi:MAG: hypothetical protein ACYCW6_01690 [Candidatus Xenobia bacterium]